MAEILKDGTGKGYTTKVDSDNRLHVNSVTRTDLTQAVLIGESDNLATGAVTLTTDAESAIAYIKYTGTDPLVIKEFLIILGTTTGGTGNRIVKVIKNPTAGTIVDNALDMDDKENNNFSSSNFIDGLFYKGAEGYTITDGTEFADTTRTSDTVIAFDAAPRVLGKGNSIAIMYTPPSGNTSQVVKVAFTVYVETATVSGD